MSSTCHNISLCLTRSLSLILALYGLGILVLAAYEIVYVTNNQYSTTNNTQIPQSLFNNTTTTALSIKNQTNTLSGITHGITDRIIHYVTHRISAPRNTSNKSNHSNANNISTNTTTTLTLTSFEWVTLVTGCVQFIQSILMVCLTETLCFNRFNMAYQTFMVSVILILATLYCTNTSKQEIRDFIPTNIRIWIDNHEWVIVFTMTVLLTTQILSLVFSYFLIRYIKYENGEEDCSYSDSSSSIWNRRTKKSRDDLQSEDDLDDAGIYHSHYDYFSPMSHSDIIKAQAVVGQPHTPAQRDVNSGMRAVTRIGSNNNMWRSRGRSRLSRKLKTVQKVRDEQRRRIHNGV
eukprot:g2564.t1